MQGVYAESASGDAFMKHQPYIGLAEEHPEPKFWVNSTDLFMKLPAEIKSMLLMDLDSKDIRNLRLVSRAFRQLPLHLFRHLIQKELPWFWEIDTIQEKKLEYTRNMYIETYGEDLSKWNDRLDDKFKQSVKETIEGKHPPETLDWKNVYQTLKMLQNGRIGVKNRVRIWSLVEDIVGRVKKLRDTPEAHKRYELRGEGEDLLHLRPTEEEKEKGMVNHDFNCMRCRYYQVERMVEEEKMDEDQS